MGAERVEAEDQRVGRVAVASLEHQLTARHRGDHPEAGDRRARGERPGPCRCVVGTPDRAGVEGCYPAREGPVDRREQGRPDVVDAGGDQRRVLVHLRQLSDLHHDLGPPAASGPHAIQRMHAGRACAPTPTRTSRCARDPASLRCASAGERRQNGETPTPRTAAALRRDPASLRCASAGERRQNGEAPHEGSRTSRCAAIWRLSGRHLLVRDAGTVWHPHTGRVADGGARLD